MDAMKILSGDWKRLSIEVPSTKGMISEDLIMTIDGRLIIGHIHMNDCIYEHTERGTSCVGAFSLGGRCPTLEFIDSASVWWISRSQCRLIHAQ